MGCLAKLFNVKVRKTYPPCDGPYTDSMYSRPCDYCGGIKFALAERKDKSRKVFSKVRVVTEVNAEKVTKWGVQFKNLTDYDETPPPVIAVTVADSMVNRKQGRWAARAKHLREMWTCASELIRRAAGAADSEHMKSWFGVNVATEKKKEVIEWSKTLREYIKQLKLIRFKCVPHDWFFAAHPVSDAKMFIDKKVLHDCRKLHPGPLEVDLGRWYRGNMFKYGEAVCALVHELTHMGIATNDGIEDLWGNGADICDQAAKINWEGTFTSAECWAYYLCSYRTGLSGDWAFMTPEEVAKRKTRKISV